MTRGTSGGEQPECICPEGRHILDGAPCDPYADQVENFDPGGYSVTITLDGEAVCEACKQTFWHIPNKEKWIRGGRKPTAQTLLAAAHFTHLRKNHPGAL